MSCSTSFQITRYNIDSLAHPFSSLPVFSECYDPTSAAIPEPLPALTEKVRLFLQEQQYRLDCIKRTPRFRTFAELGRTAVTQQNHYEDVKSVLQKTHTIPLDETTFSHILKIWEFLKTRNSVKAYLKKTPQRFKIRGYCSITLFKKELVIHLKKSTTKASVGSGLSTATRAIHIADKVRLVTELTTVLTHKNPPTQLPIEVCRVSSKEDFLVNPLINLLYEGKTALKQCRIFPHYDTDFFNIIISNDHNFFFTEETLWRMTCFVIKSVEFFHGQKLVFRDLKPENCLISFSTTPNGTLDLNNCKFAICDFATLALESRIPKDPSTAWQGSSLYWPETKEKCKEVQMQPSDIYALALVFEGILSQRDLNNKAILALINSMKNAIPSERPTINVVLSKVEIYLQETHSDYHWLLELKKNNFLKERF